MNMIAQAQAFVPEKKPKRNTTSIMIMTVMALAFSYIVTKDIVLPSWLLISVTFIGGLVLFGMGVNKPQIITYVLVAYLPFSKVLAGDFGGMAQAFNLTNLLMLFILMVWMTGKYSGGEPLWLRSPLNFPIILFSMLACLSVVRGNYYGSDHLWLAITEFKRWMTPIVMYFLVLNTVKDRPTIRNIVITMIVVTTIVGLMAIYEYIEVGTDSLEDSRIGAIAGHSNSLAAFFNYYMFLPFGFFLLNMGRAYYWLLLIPVLIQFRGIMVTFSRGGYIAFAFGLYAITFIRSKALFFMLLAVTLFTLINPFWLPQGVRYRMGQTIQNGHVEYTEAVMSEMRRGGMEQVEGSLDVSAKARLDVWRGAIQIIKEHPLFGIGYGLFFYTIRHYWSGGFSIDAHNTYLIIAAEMGIPALLAFLLVLLLVITNTFSLYRQTKDPFAKAVALGFIGGLFGLLMSNMFGSRLDSQEVSSYFWILSALVMRLRILDIKEGNYQDPKKKRLDVQHKVASHEMLVPE